MRLLLEPVSDTGDEIRFAHSRGASLVIALVAVAMAVVFWVTAAEGAARLLLTAAAGFTAVTQLLRAGYRYELTVDLPAREWRRRRGVAFAVTSAAGSLDDLEAVVLTQTWVSEGSGNRRERTPLWLVGLEFRGRGWGAPLTVGIAREEPASYALMEEYAERLRVDAVDRTGELETRRSWDALDEPVGAPDGREGEGGIRTAAAAALGAPPAGSGIEVTMAGGRRLVTLPPLGFGAVTVVAAVFGLAFAAFGAWAALGGSGVLSPITLDGEPTTGPSYLLLAVGGLFCFSGLSFAASGLRRSRLREWVRDEGELLVFGASRPGRAVSMDALPKGAIEAVTVHRPRDDGGAALRVLGFPLRGGGGGAHIRVRTDHAAVRLGARLTEPGRTWLRDAILDMART